MGKYTLHTDEVGDMAHIPSLRSELNRSLGDLVPAVHEEAEFVFEEEFPLADGGFMPGVAPPPDTNLPAGASQSFAVFPTVVKLIARISSRVLVGLPLCEFSLA